MQAEADDATSPGLSWLDWGRVLWRRLGLPVRAIAMDKPLTGQPYPASTPDSFSPIIQMNATQSA